MDSRLIFCLRLRLQTIEFQGLKILKNETTRYRVLESLNTPNKIQPREHSMGGGMDGALYIKEKYYIRYADDFAILSDSRN
ncbi:MAG: hypothetical protein A3I89_01255 [Candidatus Harrisonbacteria bacterium RIFCSPLOWO2_02_FULL_41_11]|nr:MAG: hypothetical protein A3I89_01255 [Candidatus Harrisonbacteria bacterium RIFCSPLOWO2_02_FULL_41_11]